MQRNKKLIPLLLIVLFQLSLIAARSYWECDTHPKVICQKSQTCCRKLINDPSHDQLITSFQCFEGINQICCGSTGVCAEDEYCNPISSKCEKINLLEELAEKTAIEEKKKPKLDFLFTNEENTLIINSNNNKNEEFKKLESEFENSLPNILLEMHDISRINYQKISESIPYLLQEFKDLKCCSLRNLTVFADGFMSGLKIFESAYRNSTCGADIKKVSEDWIDFFELINTINYDKDFFPKLHEAVDKLEVIYQDYRKKRKDCVPTWHKLACILKRVFDRVLDPEFPRRLADHTICNYHELKNKTNGACCALRHHEYYEAGYRFGDAYKFFMYWDFNSTASKNNNSFLMDFNECDI